MAKATASEVTLSLSAEEARVLLYICNNIGGEPNLSARAYIDNIGGALLAAGVTAPSSCTNRLHVGAFCFISNSGAARCCPPPSPAPEPGCP